MCEIESRLGRAYECSVEAFKIVGNNLGVCYSFKLKFGRFFLVNGKGYVHIKNERGA
jgi:hypothetical protein